jgi:short-subunit dehydrogenase
VVTGASGGVGRATARAFAKRGYDVALLARGEAGLEAAVADVRTEGAEALPCPVDVACYDDVERAAATIEAELGPIDVWVNNAMTTVFSPFDELDPADFERAVRVTFLGQVWGTKAALTRMRPRDRGTIINVGSALAYVGIPLQSPYCASKFACRGFVSSVRAELLHRGSHVHVGMVHLPAVNTPQFSWGKNRLRRRPMPVPPIYEPELAANAILHAVEHRRRARILGSWNKLVVAAGSIAPAFATQFAARSAWEGQLTDDPASPDDPVNLREPADTDADFGARGRFSDRAGGFLDPSFLKSLPRTAADLAAAAGATVKEAAGQRVTRG